MRSPSSILTAVGAACVAASSLTANAWAAPPAATTASAPAAAPTAATPQAAPSAPDASTPASAGTPATTSPTAEPSRPSADTQPAPSTPAESQSPSTAAPAPGYSEVVTPEPTPTAAPRRADASTSKPPSPIYEPPLPAPYVYGDPPAPLPPKHVAPKRSLWLGARAGWLFPMGSVWQDGESVRGVCCAFYNRGFDDFATSGPMLELDVGARLGRNYNVFGLWEWSILRDGDELGDEFGDQTSAQSHYVGLGLRFSSDPNSTGFVVELGVGWRRFSASWENGTELVLVDDFLNTRIGIGADIRLGPNWSLSPMLTVGGGYFTDGEWRLASGEKAGAFSFLDRDAQHVPLTLQIGGHFDAFGTNE